MEHWDREVWINEKDARLFGIWRWLKEASALEVMSLPRPKQGDDLRTYRYLCQAERDFLAFVCLPGDSYPRNILNFVEWLGPARINNRIKYAAERVERIRHWRITNMDYREMETPEASWFVDPPYQEVKHAYREHKIDYPHLAEWCERLPGEVVVCEGSKATWLDFRPLDPQPRRFGRRCGTGSLYTEYNRTRGFNKAIEAVWTRGF
jgi:hypothetical protein